MPCTLCSSRIKCPSYFQQTKFFLSPGPYTCCSFCLEVISCPPFPTPSLHMHSHALSRRQLLLIPHVPVLGSLSLGQLLWPPGLALHVPIMCSDSAYTSIVMCTPRCYNCVELFVPWSEHALWESTDCCPSLFRLQHLV